MRTVEKWLKGNLYSFTPSPPPPQPFPHKTQYSYILSLCSDIEATVKSIEIGEVGDGGGATGCHKESTDYQAEYEATELESEVEAILMQDSMEEFYSFSDTEETT